MPISLVIILLGRAGDVSARRALNKSLRLRFQSAGIAATHN